jgi:hypothetical protein
MNELDAWREKVATELAKLVLDRIEFDQMLNKDNVREALLSGFAALKIHPDWSATVEKILKDHPRNFVDPRVSWPKQSVVHWGEPRPDPRSNQTRILKDLRIAGGPLMLDRGVWAVNDQTDNNWFFVASSGFEDRLVEVEGYNPDHHRDICRGTIEILNSVGEGKLVEVRAHPKHSLFHDPMIGFARRVSVDRRPQLVDQALGCTVRRLGDQVDHLAGGPVGLALSRQDRENLVGALDGPDWDAMTEGDTDDCCDTRGRP